MRPMKPGEAIYHTNVMMCVADRFVVICLDSIRDPEEKKRVTETILFSGKEMIPISSRSNESVCGKYAAVGK